MGTNIAVSLAKTAERSAVLRVLCRSPGLTFGELLDFASSGPYAQVLSTIRVGELLVGEVLASTIDPVNEPDRPEELSAAVLAIFEAGPSARLASSMITRHLGIPRWTAQKVLRQLVATGKLHRAGTTSSTRYWLAQ